MAYERMYIHRGDNPLPNNSLDTLLSVVLYGILIVCIVNVITFVRAVDENGMDSYDRFTNLPDVGLTRDAYGYIYRNGSYDWWANFIDHNPFYL